ncbi:MAG: hypothetical protein LBT00_01975 [Spirochaetaceae bacterium]|nr:hypothetical protein [Spirochaetaceae bacterium]
MRGAKRRSNPDGKGPQLDCFATLAMTGADGRNDAGTTVIARRRQFAVSDEAIQTGKARNWIASLRSQ